MRPARWVLPIGLFVLIVALLAAIRQILTPFILAATLAYLLNPVVHYFEVRGWRRDKVVVALYLFAGFLVVIGGYFAVTQLIHEVEDFRTNYPRYLMELDRLLAKLESALFVVPYADVLLQKILANWQSYSAKLLQQLPGVAAGILPLLTLLFLVPFIAFFLMTGGPLLLNSALDFVPSRYVEMALNIACEIDESIGNYLRGLLIEAIAVGVLSWIGLWIIGLKYGLQLSIAAGVSNLVPYVGPVVGSVVGGALALIQFQTLGGVASVLAVFTVVQFIDNWVFQPMILRNAVDLHPVLILFSLMAGNELGGFLGMIFAVPVACAAKVCLQIGWEWYRTEFQVRPTPAPPEIRRIPVV